MKKSQFISIEHCPLKKELVTLLSESEYIKFNQVPPVGRVS